MTNIFVRAIDIKAGNAAMYYPEANVLVPKTVDPASKTPAFKSVLVTVGVAIENANRVALAVVAGRDFIVYIRTHLCLHGRFFPRQFVSTQFSTYACTEAKSVWPRYPFLRAAAHAEVSVPPGTRSFPPDEPQKARSW
jgi:hypothetical protein